MKKFKLFTILLAVSLFALVACGADDEKEKVEETVDEMFEDITESVQESQQEGLKDEYSGVHGELLNQELLTDEFPSDFPVPGGKVDDFEYTQSRVVLRMDTGSSVEETYAWFEENLADSDWQITESDLEDFRGHFHFQKGEWDGDVGISTGYGRQTSISIIFYNY